MTCALAATTVVVFVASCDAQISPPSMTETAGRAVSAVASEVPTGAIPDWHSEVAGEVAFVNDADGMAQALAMRTKHARCGIERT